MERQGEGFGFSKNANLWDYIRAMLVKPFSQISKIDAAIAGGKGASLGEMTQAGIPVPTGFVILADAFEQFLKETDLNVEIDSILHTVDHNEMHTVENASGKIQALILGAKMPEDIAHGIQDFYKILDTQYVAVRSSATAEDSVSAAWAGQLDSYLNTTEETLLTNVQKCWASLFTPRAIFYRFEKELHTQKISVPVAVHNSGDREYYCIAFSVHPVTEDRNQIIIEAGFGLGEAIVSGSITPDSYVVEKEPRRIIDININKQIRALYRVDSGGNEWKDIPEPKASSQVLTEKQILELLELILRIEGHYGFPCDIEWAYEGGHFYITQSRPITTLAGKERDAFITMVNMQSREHSLTYCHVWQIANQTQTRDWFESVKNILFVNNGAHKKTRVWYGQKELENIFINTGMRVKNEKDFFERVSKEFVSLTNELVPYCEGKKKIESLKEWEWFYKKWIEWWAPMAIIFVLPESKTAPESIRERALALRAQTEKYSDSGDHLVMEYLYKQYPKYKELVEFMTPDEILHIEEFTDVQINEIKSRQNGYVFFNGTLYARNELNSITAKYKIRLDEPHIQSASEIKGSCASRGKVTGSVIVIYGKKDLVRVTPNSILVTEMTSPDYVPYLKKVAAIVTDEGGVNCHAAIVSREMNIPCIIGTKIATQVLKDGDFVEVDADIGVVKILNS